MELINFEDFSKCELRKGSIIEASAIPKAKKMLKLLVSFGPDEKKTILAGIAESFKPEDLIGKNVVAILNLPPRSMFGFESEGMILAANDEEGLHLVECNCRDGISVG